MSSQPQVNLDSTYCSINVDENDSHYITTQHSFLLWVIYWTFIVNIWRGEGLEAVNECEPKSLERGKFCRTGEQRQSGRERPPRGPRGTLSPVFRLLLNQHQRKEHHPVSKKLPWGNHFVCLFLHIVVVVTPKPWPSTCRRCILHPAPHRNVQTEQKKFPHRAKECKTEIHFFQHF